MDAKCALKNYKNTGQLTPKLGNVPYKPWKTSYISLPREIWQGWVKSLQARTRKGILDPKPGRSGRPWRKRTLAMSLSRVYLPTSERTKTAFVHVANKKWSSKLCSLILHSCVSISLQAHSKVLSQTYYHGIEHQSAKYHKLLLNASVLYLTFTWFDSFDRKSTMC